MSSLIKQRGRWTAVAVMVVVGSAWMPSKADSGQPAASAAKAALSVQVVRAAPGQWPLSLSANGVIAAWQEAVIGAELSGLRLSAVLVNVGDRVKRGQVLATLQSESVQADLDNARAALLEAEAMLVEAKANADRARALNGSGALSSQDTQRSITAEQTGKARVDAAKAQMAAQALRLRQTRVLASDDGVISSRTATVGAVAQPGQELFRLIRQSRLEWRAELPSSDLLRVRPGMVAWATPPGGTAVQGRVRMVAPTVDAATRNGLVYVDLPASAMSAGARAGMFASGRLEIGQSQGLTLPQTAVQLRDGFSYVFKVSPQGQVTQTKVAVGRRVGDRVEVLQGLDAQTDVVAAGVGFLADGDQVRVVKGR
jgi:RND family efflux transporter MFP subunit